MHARADHVMSLLLQGDYPAQAGYTRLPAPACCPASVPAESGNCCAVLARQRESQCPVPAMQGAAVAGGSIRALVPIEGDSALCTQLPPVRRLGGEGSTQAPLSPRSWYPWVWWAWSWLLACLHCVAGTAGPHSRCIGALHDAGPLQHGLVLSGHACLGAIIRPVGHGCTHAGSAQSGLSH